MAITRRLFPRIEALLCFSPEPTPPRVQNTEKRPQNELAARASLCSRQMNTAQKQFSLTGVSLKKANSYH
jgi:hypothetical protein